MEGFVNEKVYDIDTKEKLLDIIQSKEARENFVEFIHDHHAEQEKWQQYYQERSRIRIIEWLRQNHFHFVFEEDLDLPRALLEKIKQSLFEAKAGKDILNARKTLVAKAKTYYSNEALNPRPKRGRPPKQAVKPEIEPQVTTDIYTTVSLPVRPFLFTPDMNQFSAFSIFSTKFETEEANQRRLGIGDEKASLDQKLASLRNLSSRWIDTEAPSKEGSLSKSAFEEFNDFDDDEDDEDEEDLDWEETESKKTKKAATKAKEKKPAKTSPKAKASKTKAEKPKVKRIMPTAKETGKITKKGLKKIMPSQKPSKSK
jgi:hypothetical protein